MDGKTTGWLLNVNKSARNESPGQQAVGSFVARVTGGYLRPRNQLDCVASCFLATNDAGSSNTGKLSFSGISIPPLTE